MKILGLPGLPPLKYRRLTGDMIELFKMVHALYNKKSSTELRFSKINFTRGNRFKLDKLDIFSMIYVNMF